MKTEYMTGAELQTVREACGLTREEFADLAQVQARTLKHWENGRAGVPADVAALAVALDLVVMRTAAQLLANAQRSLGNDGDPAVLLRYRRAQDLPRGELPDTPGKHAGHCGALLYCAAVVHARHALASSGHAVRVVWFDAEDFGLWRAERFTDDTTRARQAWAWGVLPLQAIPHRADQPPAA